MIKNTFGKTVVALGLVVSVAACSSSGGSSDGGTTGTTGTTSGTTSGGGTGTGTGGGTGGGSPGSDSGVSVNTLDRMGRPGITTAAIEAQDMRDVYNLSGDPADWAGQFQGLIRERLVTIDGLDGILGNALLDVDTISGLLVDDRLILNTAVANCDAYLAVEIGLGADDCGGRTLERDVIDDTLRHLVSQDMPVSDLADNDSILLDTWPFLGEALQNQ